MFIVVMTAPSESKPGTWGWYSSSHVGVTGTLTTKGGGKVPQRIMELYAIAKALESSPVEAMTVVTESLEVFEAIGSKATRANGLPLLEDNTNDGPNPTALVRSIAAIARKRLGETVVLSPKVASRRREYAPLRVALGERIVAVRREPALLGGFSGAKPVVKVSRGVDQVKDIEKVVAEAIRSHAVKARNTPLSDYISREIYRSGYRMPTETLSTQAAPQSKPPQPGARVVPPKSKPKPIRTSVRRTKARDLQTAITSFDFDDGPLMPEVKKPVPTVFCDSCGAPVNPLTSQCRCFTS